MRTEHEILKEIATAAPDQVKALRAELAATLSAGAQPCPNCGTAPHGMLKRPGVYEVGCLVCADPRTLFPGKTYRAQGPRAEAAVENWNAGEWLEAPRE